MSLDLAHKTKLRIFKLSWIILMFGTISDLIITERLTFPIRLSSIALMIYILTFMFIADLKNIKNLLLDKSTLLIICTLGLLLITAFISSIFSNMSRTALNVTFFRYTLYFACFIITLAHTKNFEEARTFLLRSFIFFNLFIIISCFFDFYIPRFNRILINHFGHMEGRHSLYLVPSGFVTDSDLTAFSIALSYLLVILHFDKFKLKYFLYFFSLPAGFIFGMLASRSALIVIISICIFFFIFKYIERKKLLISLSIFFVIQLLTPQTQARIGQFFNKTYIEDEMTTGRPMIWRAAFIAFQTSPVIGIGSAVFFLESRDFLTFAGEEISGHKGPAINSDDYWKMDRTNPHSIIFTMLAEYGLVGLLLFLCLLVIQYRFMIKNKMYVSLVFISGLLFVSLLSNYAPYYRYYMLICIVLYILNKDNMLVPKKENLLTNK